MKTTTERRLLPVAAVALTTWVAACHHADSILLVEVAGDLTLMPASFAVTVTAGQSGPKSIRVAPPGGGGVSLPASFTVQLPGNMTGPVTVAVLALDGSDTVIAQGTATQGDLNVGGQTILVVTLVPSGNINIVIHPPDAGHPMVDAQAPRDAGADLGGPVDAAALDAGAHDGAVHLDASVQPDARADGAQLTDGGGRS
jgi:hypothetical protein